VLSADVVVVAAAVVDRVGERKVVVWKSVWTSVTSCNTASVSGDSHGFPDCVADLCGSINNKNTILNGYQQSINTGTGTPHFQWYNESLPVYQKYTSGRVVGEKMHVYSRTPPLRRRNRVH